MLPLRAQLQARVFEPGGGRATRTDKTVPMRTRNVYLGIRPTFEGRYASEGAVTEFDIVAVDATGKQVARPAVEYRIERIDYAYQWYQVDGKWRWQSNQQRTAAHHRHAGAQGRSADAPVAPAQLGRIQADDRRQREQGPDQPVVLCRLVRRQRRRGDARHAARGERQAELHAGRERATAHRAALRRRGADRHRHRPHRRHLPGAGSGRRHDLRGADQGRMGRRRLCAGHGLAASLDAGRPHADPRHRRGVAGCRSGAAHARRADRRAREGDAAPAHRGPDQGRQPAERGGVRHPRRRRRGHPAAHAFQAAQSRRLLLRQAQAGRRHARRLRPPARRQCRRSRPHPDRRRLGRHRRPRRRADPHRRAVQRTGEARRQGRSQDRARHPRLHRPAQDNDRGLRQDARRLGRAAHVRARRGDRRRGPAALPGAQRSRPRGAVAAQCRRPGRRLSPDPGSDGRGGARPAGRRNTQAGGEPARAPDLGSQGGRRRLRQGRRLGRRAGQLRGAPRMGHPGALGPDADRRGHRLAARSASAS